MLRKNRRVFSRKSPEIYLALAFQKIIKLTLYFIFFLKKFLHLELYPEDFTKFCNAEIAEVFRGDEEVFEEKLCLSSQSFCHTFLREFLYLQKFAKKLFVLCASFIIFIRKSALKLKMSENEISTIVIGLAIQIHKKLGPGLLENVYKECLFYKIKQRGLHVEKEKSMPLVFEEIKLDCGYRIDLVVENKFIIEIKAIEALTINHLAQTLTYLKLGNYRLGLLINFNEALLKSGIRRVANNL